MTDTAPSFDQLRSQALALRAEKRHAEALHWFERALAERPGDAWTRNDLALEHLALGGHAEAGERALALTRDMPGFAPAWRTLALVARAEGRLGDALAGFEEAARRDPRDLWNAHDAALTLRALGRADDAQARWTRLAAGTPLAHALRGLAELARERGAGEDAFALLRTAGLLLPDDPWFALDAARQAAALGRHALAEEALDALLARRPDFGPAALERARLAGNESSASAALAALRRARTAAPDDEALACGEADLLRRTGREPEAETVLARFLVRRPSSIAALRALARLARERGDREAASAHLRAALALGPGDLVLRLEWAMALRDLGATEAAEQAMEALAAEPAPPVDALLELYRMRRRSAGPDAARPLLDRACALASDHPGALLLQGDDRRLAGDHAAAAAFYERALACRPNFYWALIGLAALARAEGRDGAALHSLTQAAEAEPGEAQAQIEAAALCREAGDFDAARGWLARIPTDAKRQGEAAMVKALIPRAEGHWREAAEAFEAVAHQHRERVDALAEAAEDWMRAGENSRAEACLALFQSTAPDHPTLAEAQARRALVRDDPAGARALFERAAESDPTRLSAWLGAARARAMAGDMAGALEGLAGIAQRFGPRPEEAALRADLLRQAGRLFDAHAALAEARRRFPHHAHLWQQAQVERIEAGAFAEVEEALSAPPPVIAREDGRRAFVASLLASARWDFARAVREGKAAASRLPGDGWVRNRLIHAALLGLDMDRAGSHLAALAELEAGASRLKGKSANPSQSHYGQLHDEFRLDEDALVALRSALAQAEPQARLGALRASVAAFPDSTIAALQLLIELRRQGVGPMAAQAEPLDTPGAIPLVLHQFWDEPPVPPDVAAYAGTWRAENEGMAHRLWSRAEAEDFLRERGLADALAAFRRALQPAMKADLFRLALLGEEGGVYADADDRCLAPIRPLLAGGVGFLSYQEDLGSLGNNVLAAVPGHPIVRLARDLACAAVNRGDNDILWLSTGPGLLSRAAARLLATQPDAMRDVRIIDRHQLSRFVAIHCLTGYKSTERHWSRTAFGRAARPARRA